MMRTTVPMCIATILCTLVTTMARAEGPAPMRSPGHRTATAPSDEAGRYRSRQLELPSGPAQPTRLELSILQLTCPTGILPGIDINRLTAGNAAPSVILDRLQQYGEASVAFQADNLINLPAGADITQGARVPVVKDVIVTGNGTVTPSVTYEKVGAIVRIRGLWRGDEPQLADVAARIEVSAITQTPILVGSGVSLPGFNMLSLEQTLQVRSGVPCCSIINASPVRSDTESVSTVHLLYLRLTREGETASAPPAAAATPLPPQTMIQATVFEVTGEKEKLAQMNLGNEPPTDPQKLEEALGWFGKVKEISNPSLLAIWPSKSTLTMSMTLPETVPAGERQRPDRPNRGRPGSLIASKRIETTLGIDGRWSDNDPKQGNVSVVLSRRATVRSGPNAQTQPAETGLLTAKADIRDAVPRCFLGEILPGDAKDDPAHRYVILLTARRIAEIPATADEPK